MFQIKSAPGGRGGGRLEEIRDISQVWELLSFELVVVKNKVTNTKWLQYDLVTFTWLICALTPIL